MNKKIFFFLDVGLTGMPPLQEMPAPVMTKTLLLICIQAASSVTRGSMTSDGSEMTIFTFIARVIKSYSIYVEI